MPRIFGWFKKKRSDFFVESIIQLTKENTDIRELYFRNGVNSIDHVKKMNQNFVKKWLKKLLKISKN